MELSIYLKNIIKAGNFLGKGLETRERIWRKCYSASNRINNRMITKEELEILYNYLKTYTASPLIVNLK